MTPEVTIIIPLYNKENYILETLQSVSNQTFKNWLCIIIDDGSTDDSFQKANNFIKNDSRFILIRRPDHKVKGASSCRNIGIQLAKSTYIQFLDADDIISEEKIEDQIKLLQNENTFSIAICSWGRFGNEKKFYDNLSSYSDFKLPEDFLISLISSKGYFPIHSYLIHREIIELTGHWNECLKLNDDGEFILRVIANSYNIKFSVKGIAWYRWATDNNLSSFCSKNNVEKAILSWQLIEAQLKIKFEERVDEFIDWNKEQLYKNVKSSYPKLLKKHYFFFIKSIKKDNNLLIFRIINKLEMYKR
ncbi:Glycosyl transferase family 2 [Salegentibacter agarivorans]|uniref:Glycosyl transferase family 2 n=1 Tax=Salegentibacter agarivorans TaxID=345907 RepID=A0A1I2LA38_9FLAO|nr:glycosyltransferase family 2 protein [Salegentibacter agarivorans]SFF74357.1 Glycosyl transferase family 2 [Salegentibacter agarivorans]